MNKSAVLLLSVALMVSLAGCGSRAVGVYSGGQDIFKMTVDLKANGNAYLTTAAGTEQGTYALDGDKVIIKLGKSRTVFTLTPEGTLEDGPFGLTLKKERAD